METNEIKTNDQLQVVVSPLLTEIAESVFYLDDHRATCSLCPHVVTYMDDGKDNYSAETVAEYIYDEWEENPEKTDWKSVTEAEGYQLLQLGGQDVEFIDFKESPDYKYMEWWTDEMKICRYQVLTNGKFYFYTCLNKL
jgi:hypothetical protein